jgi:NADPH-dependent ferric siderophore reductase
VTHPDARVDLHRDVDITWHVATDKADAEEQLSNAVRSTNLEPGIRVWAAGEAATMQRIRKYLFTEIGFPRSQAHVRGYWKHSIR